MVYFWTGRGSYGSATVTGVTDDRLFLNPEPEAHKGSDYRILHSGAEWWLPRNIGVPLDQVDTPPRFWYVNFLASFWRWAFMFQRLAPTPHSPRRGFRFEAYVALVKPSPAECQKAPDELKYSSRRATRLSAAIQICLSTLYSAAASSPATCAPSS